MRMYARTIPRFASAATTKNDSVLPSVSLGLQEQSECALDVCADAVDFPKRAAHHAEHQLLGLVSIAKELGGVGAPLLVLLHEFEICGTGKEQVRHFPSRFVTNR